MTIVPTLCIVAKTVFDSIKPQIYAYFCLSRKITKQRERFFQGMLKLRTCFVCQLCRGLAQVI